MAYMRKINGRWFGYFSDANRKPKQKSVPLDTGLKSAATLRFNELQRRFADPKDPFDPWNPGADAQKHVVLSAAVEEFKVDRSHLRPKTQVAYRTATTGLLSHTPPDLVTTYLSADHVRPYVEDASVSAATRRHRYRHLAAFFKWSQDRGYLSKNPLDEIRLPKEQKQVAAFLTVSQLERLLAAIDADATMKRSEGQAREKEITWLKDLILIAVGTGLRRGELVNLRWQDIDLETRFLTVRNRDSGFQTKSGHERSIPLVGDALEVIRRLNAQRTDEIDGPVLTGVGGGPLNPGFVSRRFRHYVKLARLPEGIHFHTLRHTCASWLVQRGVNLSIVQHILGHSSIHVTQRYAHLAPDVMQSAMLQAFGSLSCR